MEVVKKQGNTYIISIKRDYDFLETLTFFCEQSQIHAAYITAIGACGELTLAWYNLETKSYEDHEYAEDMEIASIIGNAALVDGKVFIHAHGTFGKRDMSVVGGHIRKLVISAACEVRLEVFEGDMQRKHDEFTGLNLITCDMV